MKFKTQEMMQLRSDVQASLIQCRTLGTPLTLLRTGTKAAVDNVERMIHDLRQLE